MRIVPVCLWTFCSCGLVLLTLLPGCGSGTGGGQRTVTNDDFVSATITPSTESTSSLRRVVVPVDAEPSLPSTQVVTNGDHTPTNDTTVTSTPGTTTNTSANLLAGSLSNSPAEEAAVRQFFAELPTPTITPTLTTAQARQLSIDGMVGQVNGQAIYASRVFGPLSEQLARLGQTLSPAAFRQEAARPILATLEEIVFNNLILGEAERDLSSQEQAGLNALLRTEREKLMRRWGAGSRIVADQTLREREGKTLDEKMVEIRQQVLVQRYLQQKLFPRINITRKDIERFYNDNRTRFQPEPTRLVRLIRADGATAAQQIETALSEGDPFAQVARLRANAYRREQGGLFAEKIVGNEIFGIAPLNDAVLQLQAGEHSARIDVGQTGYWVFVESLELGKARSLREAQTEIEELLRRQRFQQLLARYRSTLFARGSYNPIPQMAESLLEIAVNRYARTAG